MAIYISKNYAVIIYVVILILVRFDWSSVQLNSIAINVVEKSSDEEEFREMEEREFRRLLDLFPVVRSREYDIQEGKGAWDSEGDGGMIDALDNLHGEFWKKLKAAAERQVGRVAAERFCKAFQKVYKKTVFEELSLDAARSFLNLSKS